MAETVTRRVCDALRAVLPPKADLIVLDAHHGDLRLNLGGQPVTARWVPRGWPRQVADALRDRPPADLLVAPKFSAGARATAEAADTSWVDETGAASIHLDPVIIVRSPAVRSRPAEATASRWTPATFAVVEALLTGTAGTVKAMSERTELASGTVARALRQLQDEGLLEAEATRGRHARRIVTDPMALLDHYAGWVERLGPPDPPLAVAVEPGDPVAEALHASSAWNAVPRRWAATGALAAVFQGPYLQRPAPLQIYIDVAGLSGLVAAAREAQLEQAPGGRLTLLPFPSVATARMSLPVDNQPGVWCVPWPRTYADLRTVGVRGEEAAEHLRALHLPEPERLHGG